VKSRGNWLVEDRSVAGQILVYDGRDERDELVPELEARHAARTLVGGVVGLADRAGMARVAVRLELSLVELVAVVEEELVGGLEAGHHAVFDDVARPRRRRQVLHL